MDTVTYWHQHKELRCLGWYRHYLNKPRDDQLRNTVYLPPQPILYRTLMVVRPADPLVLLVTHRLISSYRYTVQRR